MGHSLQVCAVVLLVILACLWLVGVGVYGSSINQVNGDISVREGFALAIVLAVVYPCNLLLTLYVALKYRAK